MPIHDVAVALVVLLAVIVVAVGVIGLRLSELAEVVVLAASAPDRSFVQRI